MAAAINQPGGMSLHEPSLEKWSVPPAMLLRQASSDSSHALERDWEKAGSSCYLEGSWGGAGKRMAVAMLFAGVVHSC